MFDLITSINLNNLLCYFGTEEEDKFTIQREVISKDDSKLNENNEFQNPIILCGFINSNRRQVEFVQQLQEMTGYQVVCLRLNQSCIFKPSEKVCVVDYNLTSEGVHKLVKRASYICSDSFDLIADAVINKKDFFVIRSKEKSKDTNQSRLEWLLQTCDLSSRIIDNKVMKEDILLPIAYNKLSQKMKNYRLA